MLLVSSISLPYMSWSLESSTSTCRGQRMLLFDVESGQIVISQQWTKPRSTRKTLSQCYHPHTQGKLGLNPAHQKTWLATQQLHPTDLPVSLSKNVLHSPTNIPICHPEEKPFNNLHGAKLPARPSAQLAQPCCADAHETSPSAFKPRGPGSHA